MPDTHATPIDPNYDDTLCAQCGRRLFFDGTDDAGNRIWSHVHVGTGDYWREGVDESTSSDDPAVTRGRDDSGEPWLRVSYRDTDVIIRPDGSRGVLVEVDGEAVLSFSDGRDVEPRG